LTMAIIKIKAFSLKTHFKKILWEIKT